MFSMQTERSGKRMGFFKQPFAVGKRYRIWECLMPAGGVSPPDAPGSHPPSKMAVPGHKLFTAFFCERHFIPFSKKTPAAKIPSLYLFIYLFMVFICYLLGQ